MLDTINEKNALKLINSTILNCEKMLNKFDEGSSQHSLLINRIRALKIARDLILEEDISELYSMADLKEALPPIQSIISKSQKGISKFIEGQGAYTRFSKIITTMQLAEKLLEGEINQ